MSSGHVPNFFSAAYLLGSIEIKVGVIVFLPLPMKLYHPRPKPQKRPPKVTDAGCYAPSPWRSTQVQQGSGFLQELKAAIQLNQFESRAGTITWGR